jgi:hypothetical protein
LFGLRGSGFHKSEKPRELNQIIGGGVILKPFIKRRNVIFAVQ